ncbi:hypothetical protein GOP47_0028134 [Adiantum capillus-veneris]|nr:hypothetical protein GOP47_0028134 [Adiantum capillus-veneris]
MHVFDNATEAIRGVEAKLGAFKGEARASSHPLENATIALRKGEKKPPLSTTLFQEQGVGLFYNTALVLDVHMPLF